MPPPQAEARALAEFRDRDTLSRHLSPLRQARVPTPPTPGPRTGRWLGDLWRDVRYTVRLLRRSPGFTVAASLTVALVLGANTAIFSLIDAVLVRSLPVDRPHELVFLRATGGDGTTTAPPYPWIARARQDTGTFAGMAVFASDEQRVEIDGRAEQVFGQVRVGEFLRRPRRPAAPRPAAHAGRRADGTAGRGDRLWLLAAPLRRTGRRPRPDDHHRRADVRHRRRDAAGVLRIAAGPARGGDHADRCGRGRCSATRTDRGARPSPGCGLE